MLAIVSVRLSPNSGNIVHIAAMHSMDLQTTLWNHLHCESVEILLAKVMSKDSSVFVQTDILESIDINLECP